jgi:penicillin-binding protein 1A
MTPTDTPGQPPGAGARRRIQIDNPHDGGFIFWLVRLYAFAAIALLSTAAYLMVGVYIYFSSTLPPLPDLSRYADSAPGVTQIYGADGTLIAELSRERREVVPLDRVPQQLVDAFIATEDRRFFSHSGIDYRGTLRALVTNLRAGQVAQGGSTITQQIAKSYLSSVRSYSRKIREAILARRLEARYSKRAILALYLNQIYLGNGAYGVEAAARRYFDKDVTELDLGEMAMIGGLARAPSRDSPLVSASAAKDRRNQVLRNMVDAGKITVDEAKKWLDGPVPVRARRDYFHEVTPYFAEHVRREMITRYGEERIAELTESERSTQLARIKADLVRRWGERSGKADDEDARRELARELGEAKLYAVGLRIETTVIPQLDVLAQDNVDVAVRKLDKRQGWRGPEAHLGPDLARIFRERAAELYGDAPLVEGKLYLGLVEGVTSAQATVSVGGRTYPLPVANMKWAARYSQSDATNDKQIGSATEALHKGDVVWVRWAYRSRIERFTEFTYNEEGDATWTPEQPLRKPPSGAQVLLLEQRPKVSGALFTFDHENGYVLAMAGGNDFDASEFNRVVQACRQPGSAYKPIYYSLALDRGYSFNTEWNDRPKAEVDPVTGELWVPQNVDGTYSVRVSLERALVWSKNPPSVEIFETLGAKDVEKWARRFGFTTPIIADKALALGASCVHPDELSRAFAVFARNGRPVENVYIRRVLDKHNRVVEDHTAWDDPMLPPADRFDRIAARFAVEPEPAIAPRTAWLTSNLLRKIVTQGHSGPIRSTKVIAAGKTGTSSHTSDVWFVGYTSKWLTTAWIGDDTYDRQLGFKDASFMLSVPMWARFMYQAVMGQPLAEIPWDRPAGVKVNDVGGPLKPGFPPPPPPGYDPSGNAYGLPSRLQGVMTMPAPGGAAPAPGGVAPAGGAPATATTPAAGPSGELQKQKIIRVQSAAPAPPKPAAATKPAKPPAKH